MHFFIIDILTEQLEYQLLRTLEKCTNKNPMDNLHKIDKRIRTQKQD